MRYLILLLTTLSFASFGQLPRQPDAASIKLKMKKLNFLGTVLYVAAHPDDENTSAIAYLSNEKLATTGYLSMTRGDGGQNLIGPEIRDQLGLIRTQELLAARRIDGGYQFFTRANDFGYSKSPEEAFRIWNKEEILSDVVQVIRQFKPDVILTRFPNDGRGGHGHHTASAILAQEAFDLTNDPSKFPEQVAKTGLWQVQGVYTNTGRWWNKDITKDTPGIVTLDIGVYNPLLGKSYSEISAESRTQHKSQGFGSSGRRGESLEFFEFEKGYHAKNDFFENVNTTWTRVKGGEKVGVLVKKLMNEYNEEDPSQSIPTLLQVRKAIASLEDGIWKTRKLEEVNNLIRDCTGLFVQAVADNYYVAPGDQVRVSYEVVNRSNASLKLVKAQGEGLKLDSTINVQLINNIPFTFSSTRKVDPSLPYSDPYWLKEPHSLGRFTVADRKLIGKPENDPAIIHYFQFEVAGEQLLISVPLVYKWTDPVKGELSRPFEIVPPVTINLSESVVIFNSNDGKPIHALVKSHSGNPVIGNVTLDLPKGWRSEPDQIEFTLKNRGEEASVDFRVYPSSEELTSSLHASVAIGDRTFKKAMQIIDYDHIPIQTLLPDAEAKLVRLNLKKAGAVVGYVQGAGDEIPAALRNIGYEVWEMKNEEVTAENLLRVDAVVLGIRALNTNSRLPFFMADLLTYVKNGGTLIVQYNTSRGLEIEEDKFSPYPLSLSRDRVTDEESEIKILKPNHPALNFPNKISRTDFDGWVQERGLYFPDKWDPQYEAILSMKDPGEEPSEGALLISKYGKGYYVYTGLSFFRELPEGVAGAYKLFTNLVSLSKAEHSEDQKIKSEK